MSAPQQQIAVTVERIGATVAAGGGMWIWLAENQQAIAALGIIVGIVLGVAGFAVNWWYLHRNSKRPRA